MQFPDVSAGGRRNVSTHGGTEPAWSPRGGELFFRDASGNMVSVEVKTAPSFSFGAPKVLFPATAYATYDGRTQYDVSHDGQRFLMVRKIGGGQSSQLVLVKNWLTEFKAKSGAR